MSKFSNKIIDSIKKKEINPKPKWYFIIFNISLWTLVILATILGSMAFAIIIRHFTLTDWQLARHASRGPISSFLLVLPYIWFLLIGIIIVISEKLFIHTKKGYKIKPKYIALGSIGISLLGGIFLFITHVDVPFERGLRDHIPSYQSHMESRDRRFVSPDNGVLVGRITNINFKKSIIIIDFKESKWVVDISDANIRSDFNLTIGTVVGILGEKIDDSHFDADHIKPWRRGVLQKNKKSERNLNEMRSNR